MSEIVFFTELMMGYRPPTRLRPPPSPPNADDLREGNIDYLKSKYATGFITLEELEQGLEHVLSGGGINVPKGRIVAPPKPADARRSAVPPWADAR